MSNALSWDYDAPLITSLSPNPLPTTGGELSIIGSNFGAGANPITVTNAGAAVGALVLRTQTLVTFNVPAGSGTLSAITVQVGTQVESRSVEEGEVE